jgi:hypothetical protein
MLLNTNKHIISDMYCKFIFQSIKLHKIQRFTQFYEIALGQAICIETALTDYIIRLITLSVIPLSGITSSSDCNIVEAA